ncbi:MAG: hypothetical protein AABO57_15650 [Acidobacteriota bacterium]
MNPVRILLGYLIAPLAVPFAFIALDALGGSFRLREFPSILLLYGVFPYLIATLFFVPLMFILKRAGNLGWVYFVVAGGIGGVVVALISSVVSESNASLYVALMLSGALSSLVFFKIAMSDS